MNQLLRTQIYKEVRDIFSKYKLTMQEKHDIINDLVLGHHVRIDLEHIRDEIRGIHKKNVEDIKKLEKAKRDGKI